MTEAHISVLKQEVLDAFDGCALRVMVDGTLGAGGHALALLDQHPEMERYLGIDQDPSARKLAAERLSEHSERLEVVAGNFEQLQEILEERDIESVDGILLDLGVSSMQLDQAERGFSFNKDGPLDMRMNPGQDLSAEEIVNSWSEEELGSIFRLYGEEKRWRNAARQVCRKRKEKRFTRTRELAEVLAPVVGPPKKGKSHPLTKVFQALRIAVNSELDVVRNVLPVAIRFLAKGGRLAVISFHSLEDRIVKQLFRDYASDKVSTSGVGGLFLDKEPEVRLLTRKPVVASKEELERNPRSRSAKLRVVEKL